MMIAFIISCRPRLTCLGAWDDGGGGFDHDFGKEKAFRAGLGMYTEYVGDYLRSVGGRRLGVLLAPGIIIPAEKDEARS